MAPQYAGRPPRSEAPNLKCDGAEIGTAEERADILQVAARQVAMFFLFPGTGDVDLEVQ